MKTAVLVDGGFFIKIYLKGWRKANTSNPSTHPDPKQMADDLHKMCLECISKANNHLHTSKELYRILYYDCPPFSGGSLNPVSKQHTHYGKTETAKFRNAFHTELKKKRKVAIRLGRIANKPRWILTPPRMEDFLKNPDTFVLSADDVILDMRQKGVDMKIGLDIAALALKNMVDQLILISGDSDFVPAAKLARREGVDFVLNAMGNHINEDLHEHIDGLQFNQPNYVGN